MRGDEKSGYVTDQCDYENLIRLYEEKEEGEPLFLFNVTMQNHSGYQMPWTNLPREVWLTGDLENHFQTVNQYLSLIYQSDQALEYLIHYFSQVEEPTMILLFGDHQPQVATNFYTDVLGIDPPTELAQKKQMVPFFLWANYDIPEAGGIQLSLNYLSALLMDTANLPMTGYQKFLSQLWETAPVINTVGIRDAQGQDLAWEACVTMNNNWGYCANDHYFKPAPMLIKKLVECVSKGGNLLLNVGPDARGNIPPQSLEILRQIGAWMKDNSQSIYGCGKAGLEKPDNGRITRRGNKLYYHLFENTIGPMPLPGVKAEEVEYVRYLATGAEVPISNSWTHSNFPDIVFADLGPDPILPDPVNTVLEVTLKE